MSTVIYHYECPRCAGKCDSTAKQRIKCGECLMTNVEIVELVLVSINIDGERTSIATQAVP